MWRGFIHDSKSLSLDEVCQHERYGGNSLKECPPGHDYFISSLTSSTPILSSSPFVLTSKAYGIVHELENQNLR